MKTHERHKAKWFRPRFSVRVLLIVLTLICAYLACWNPTKEQGVRDVLKHVNDVYYRRLVVHKGIEREAYHAAMAIPLVVRTDEREVDGWLATGPSYRRYYFWFFGYVARLPYERKLGRNMVRELIDIDVSFPVPEVPSDTGGR